MRLASLFLLVLTALCSMPSHVTAQSYNFQMVAEPYVELTNPDFAIPDDSPYWDQVVIRPKMMFPAFGSQYDLNTGVYVVLESGYVFFTNATRSTTIYACETGLEPRRGPEETSEFSFKFTTVQGQDVFKLQWKNMGLTRGVPEEFLNFQLWLWENGRIEVRFGECNASPGAFEFAGPAVGLLNMDEEFTTIFEEAYLNGPSTSPVFTEGSTGNLNGGPISSSLLMFTPKTASVSDEIPNADRLQIYESAGRLHVTSLTEPSILRLTNILGQSALVAEIEPSQPIDISHLTPGVYHASCVTDGRAIHSGMFVKR